MTYEQTTEDCLKEMFRRVGLSYPDKEFTSQDEWYTKRSWTREEEDDFEEWMDTLLKKRHRLNKRRRAKEIAFFTLMWGWKIKE